MQNTPNASWKNQDSTISTRSCVVYAVLEAQTFCSSNLLNLLSKVIFVLLFVCVGPSCEKKQVGYTSNCAENEANQFNSHLHQ